MNYETFLGGKWANGPGNMASDRERLHFIAGLGATARMSARALHACMSHRASDAARMMAVEIAERRLAEMPTLPPAEGAGACEGGVRARLKTAEWQLRAARRAIESMIGKNP